MKPQPSICLLSALAMAGALLHGCEGGIDQIAPGGVVDNELIAAYVDPLTPAPGTLDGDKLPQIDGDPQDREWNAARPLYVYVSGSQATGGGGYYVELRAAWSDDGRSGGGKDQLYMLVRYGDETFDIFPDYWRYARLGALGLVPSPVPATVPTGAPCDSVIVDGRNWYVENPDGAEDQVAIVFEKTPASDSRGTFAELGCAVACHAGGGRNFGVVPEGELDVWMWRAGRTNAQRSTGYPDFTQIDDEDGRPASSYSQRFDPTTTWPAYMDDMHASAVGLVSDAGDPEYPFYSRNRGQAWTRNETQRSGQPETIPLWLTEEQPQEARATGSGPGPTEPVEPANDGLPTTLYLWGPKATRFTECDTIPWSRIFSGSVEPRWSERLGEGETDVLPGYALWIPSGSAADVRARGDFRENAQKRFPIWALEIRRSFDTGFADDIVFDETKEFNFAIAIFDRSSKIHSGSGPLKLRFQPSVYGAASTIQKASTPAPEATTAGRKGGRS